jgi:hypothetical protein
MELPPILRSGSESVASMPSFIRALKVERRLAAPEGLLEYDSMGFSSRAVQLHSGAHAGDEGK